MTRIKHPRGDDGTPIRASRVPDARDPDTGDRQHAMPRAEVASAPPTVASRIPIPVAHLRDRHLDGLRQALGALRAHQGESVAAVDEGALQTWRTALAARPIGAATRFTYPERGGDARR